MTQVFLETNDQQKFEVNKIIISRSELIKDLLEDCDGNSSDNPIPLPSVSGPCLEKIISWCTRNKDLLGVKLEELEGSDIFSPMNRSLMEEISVYLDQPLIDYDKLIFEKRDNLDQNKKL